MTTSRLLILWTAAFLLSAGGCWWLLAGWAPGLTPGSLFLDAGIIGKLCMLLSLPIGLVGVIGGLTRTRLMVWIGGGFAALLGALGAGWTELTIQSVISRVGPVNFAVAAISHAEALFVLAFGLFPGVVALLALWLRERGGAR